MWNNEPSHELEFIRPLPKVDFVVTPKLRLKKAKEREGPNDSFKVKPRRLIDMQDDHYNHGILDGQ